jgi:hypothetical protein
LLTETQNTIILLKYDHYKPNITPSNMTYLLLKGNN